MKKISFVVSTVLLASSVYASSIDEAFKNGTVESSIALFANKVDYKKGDEKDTSYGNGHLRIAYTTDSFEGFNLGIEAKGNIKLGEKNKGDREADFANNALFTQAYLQYGLEDVFSVKAGRFEADNEWLKDYQQGVIAEISAISDTVVALGYSNKMAASDHSESSYFEKVGKKGVYFLEAENKSIESLAIKPYFYSIKNMTNFYGLKLALDTDFLAASAHYAKSNTDSKYLDKETGEQIKNGKLLHLEASAKVEDFTASLGYVKTDKEGGVAAMDSYGESTSPFEDGNKIFEADAKTTYAKAEYSIAGFDLAAVYGVTKYAKEKEKELNLGASYGFTDNLSAELMFVNVKNKNDQADSNYNKYLAKVEYSF